MFCYIAGLLIMSVGSNLFLKAALGVAPSCTIALALSEIFPSHSYAVFNFLVNSFLLLCEIAVVKKVEKKQAVQLALTFLYSLFIQWTAAPLQFISAVVSITCLGNFSAVGVGTVIAAVCTGAITNLLSRIFAGGFRFSHSAA